MTNIIYTRWLHIKRQLFSLALWLLLPIIVTIVLVNVINIVKDDTSIPVGVVLEEETPLALELVEKLEEESFFTVILLEEKEALNELKKHELDSVFIVKEGYETQVQKGNRNKLLRGYESDMSFAYASTLETVQSLVQQQTSRYKAANEVAKLYKQFDQSLDLTEEQLIERSKEIEAERTLLRTSLTYAGEEQSEKAANNLVSPILIWAFLVFLSTFFLFDWVMKEKHAHVTIRFLYTKKSFTTYLIEHLILYTITLFIVDVLTIYIFHLLYDEPFTMKMISTLFIYRLLLNSSAFLVSIIMKRPFVFYMAGLSLFFICVVTYIIGITSQTTLFLWLHPMEAFLQGRYINLWLLLNIGCILFMMVQRRDVYVKRSAN